MEDFDKVASDTFDELWAKVTKKEKKPSSDMVTKPLSNEEKYNPAGAFNNATLRLGPFDTGAPIPNIFAEKLAALGGGMLSPIRGLNNLVGGQNDTSKEDFNAARNSLGKDNVLNRVLGFGGEAAVTSPAMFIPGLGAPALAARIGAGALTGAGLGFTTTEGGGQERLSNAATGGLFGAAMPVVGHGIADLGNAILPFLGKYGAEKLAGRAVIDKLGADKTRAAAADMESGQGLLSGSNPTAAQLVNDPQAKAYFASMEKALAAKEGGLLKGEPGFNARVADQNKALTDITGRKSAGLLGDIAERTKITSPMYENAQVRPDFHLPYIKGQMTKLANEAPQYTAAVEWANKNIPAGSGIKKDMADPRYLQLIKKGFDDQLETATGPSLNAITAAKEQYVKRISDYLSPDLKAARNMFQEMSVPVNQKQAWQTLDEKLNPALADFGAEGANIPQAFKAALGDMDKTVQKATKFKRTSAAEILPEQDMGLLSDMAKDISRRSNTAQSAKGFPADNFDMYAQNNLFGEKLPYGTRSISEFIYNKPNDEVNKLFIQMGLNPKEGAELLKKAAGKSYSDMTFTEKRLFNAANTLKDGGGLLAFPMSQNMFSDKRK